MRYSDQELKKIEEWAQIYLPVSDMAVILDVRDKTSPAYKAYHRGKVLSKVQLRTQEMKLARIGSPLALDNTRKNLLDMEDDE